MHHRPRHLAPLLALAVVVLAACGGAIDNGDLFSKDQGTSSGAPGATTTPTATAQPTASSAPKPSPPSATCGTSFKNDVMLVFQQTACSNLECHGGPLPKNPPRVDTLDAAATYKELLGFVLSDGSPYVVQSKDPKDSSLNCNLRDNCGVGMPIGRKISSKQLAVVDAWLACGAPFN
jgi:hypothetical protein